MSSSYVSTETKKQWVFPNYFFFYFWCAKCFGRSSLQYCCYNLEPPDRWEQFSFLCKNEFRMCVDGLQALQTQCIQQKPFTVLLSQLRSSSAPHYTNGLASIRPHSFRPRHHFWFSPVLNCSRMFANLGYWIRFSSLVVAASTLRVELWRVTAVWSSFVQCPILPVYILHRYQLSLNYGSTHTAPAALTNSVAAHCLLKSPTSFIMFTAESKMGLLAFFSSVPSFLP